MLQPFFSVIVLNWNGAQFLRDCLGSLRGQTFQDFETILVDNGSSDGSIALASSEFPEVQVIALKANLGFCSGNNKGIRAAKGDFIMLLNNDTFVDCDMLSELHESIQASTTDVGSWATRMLRMDRHELVDNCGCGYSAFGTGFGIGAGDHKSRHESAKDVFCPSGGAGCYRRSVLDEVGFLDDDFFFNNEDVDLGFRIQLAGYTCRYVPSAIVYHYGSATGGVDSDMVVYHILRNKEWVFFKNMPSWMLLKYSPQHIAYSFAWVAYWTTRGKGKVAWRAKWDASRAWRQIWRKRKAIQSQRRIDLRSLDRMIDKRRILSAQRIERMKASFLGTDAVA